MHPQSLLIERDRRGRGRARRVEEPASDDEGSAALEFIVVGVLMLVPLVYLIVALGLIQGQSLGVESGARHIARVVALSSDPDAAASAADSILRSVIDEYGLDPDDVAVTLQCRPAGMGCPAAGATVIVTVSARVALPLVPPVLGLEKLTVIPVEASAAQKVSRFWDAE